jgi:ATPase subunit of ABC transporter with duplicated ATPase domains
MKDILRIQKAEYTLPTGELLWTIENLNVSGNEKIGLVGKNGTGKSTLFECINGNKELSEGVIIKSDDSFYIPQQKNKSEDDFSVTELVALNKITNNEFVKVLGETYSNENSDFLTRKLNILSGGEYLKVYLVIAKILNRKLLLLDEPTNHLDTKGIDFVRSLLVSFSGAFICISHDTRFLDSVVKKIWSLEKNEIKVYGGNYSFYKNMKDIEQSSILRQVSNKNKEIKKVKKTIALQKDRQQKNEREGRKQKNDTSMSKMEIGFAKENSQKSRGKNLSKLAEVLSQKEKELSDLGLEKKINLKLKIRNRINNGKIVSIKNGYLYVGEKILVKDINLEVFGGDRIRISGSNGVGKSYLCKNIINKELREKNFKSEKLYFQDNANIVYLDQFYTILDEEKTVLENVREICGGLTLEEMRKHLSSMLFKDQGSVNKKVKYLSGGERARVAIAMITSSNVDLLILDEPTNNLDIDTIEKFIETLQDFEGAIILISHNEDFSDRINISKRYNIEDSKFGVF